MAQNRFRIQAHELNVELTGDAEYVIQSYEALRSVLYARFQATLSGENQESLPPEQRATRALHRVTPEEASAQRLNLSKSGKSAQTTSEAPLPPYMHLAVAGEVYHKICLMETRAFVASVFGQHLDPRHIARVCVDTRHADIVERHVPVGEVLWREWTEAGKAALRGGG